MSLHHHHSNVQSAGKRDAEQCIYTSIDCKQQEEPVDIVVVVMLLSCVKS